MTEKPKPADHNGEKPAEDPPDEQTWSEDQKKHRYYYDDAHGYEVYEPDTEEADEDED
jgi:hypothetical protein